jgi:hypothetical protein
MADPVSISKPAPQGPEFTEAQRLRLAPGEPHTGVVYAKGKPAVHFSELTEEQIKRAITLHLDQLDFAEAKKVLAFTIARTRVLTNLRLAK